MVKVLRIIIYMGGLGILAFGVVLNTKTGYGVSPINAIPYSISIISGLSLGVITIVIYCIYVVLEILLMKDRFTWKVLLQVPFSILFGYFTNIINSVLTYSISNHIIRIFLLGTAIFCTALGIVMTISMKLVPNAPDGLTQEIGVAIHKDFGFAKNILDFNCVILTIIISCFFKGRIIGIGIGTIIAVIMIGRTVSIMNIICEKKFLTCKFGLEQEKRHG